MQHSFPYCYYFLQGENIKFCSVVVQALSVVKQFMLESLFRSHSSGEM